MIARSIVGLVIAMATSLAGAEEKFSWSKVRDEDLVVIAVFGGAVLACLILLSLVVWWLRTYP